VDVSSGVIAIVGHYTRKDNAAGKKPFPVRTIFLNIRKTGQKLVLLGVANDNEMAENRHMWSKKAIGAREFELR
jgi:hypothetical protein